MENQWILIGRDTLGLIHFDDNASFQSEGKKLFKTFIIHTRYLAQIFRILKGAVLVAVSEKGVYEFIADAGLEIKKIDTPANETI